MIELIVVIMVIGILIALLVPVFQRILEGGRATACISNLRQLGTGLTAYLSDHNNVMPELKVARDLVTDDVPVIDNTLDKYVGEKRIFACPADRKGFAEKSGTSYVWNIALNGQSVASLNFLGMSEDHSRIPILSDKEGFHPYLEDKVNLLYADGHVTKDLRFFTKD